MRHILYSQLIQDDLILTFVKNQPWGDCCWKHYDPTVQPGWAIVCSRDIGCDWSFLFASRTRWNSSRIRRCHAAAGAPLSLPQCRTRGSPHATPSRLTNLRTFWAAIEAHSNLTECILAALRYRWIPRTAEHVYVHIYVHIHARQVRRARSHLCLWWSKEPREREIYNIIIVAYWTKTCSRFLHIIIFVDN